MAFDGTAANDALHGLVLGAGLACAAVCLGSCGISPAGRDVLARVGDQNLTVGELDAALLAQPPAARQVPAGADAATWLEGKLQGYGGVCRVPGRCCDDHF